MLLCRLPSCFGGIPPLARHGKSMEGGDPDENRFKMLVATVGVSIGLGVGALALMPSPVVATQNCGVGQPQCGCPDAIQNPDTGQWCYLSNWFCFSDPNGCDRKCYYSC